MNFNKVKEKVLIQPLISEKSYTVANAENVYTFKVASSANKMQIADAVSEDYKVKVESVRVVNIRPRAVRFGKNRRTGLKSAWKKAMVKLVKGDKIEIFDVK